MQLDGTFHFNGELRPEDVDELKRLRKRHKGGAYRHRHYPARYMPVFGRVTSRCFICDQEIPDAVA